MADSWQNAVNIAFEIQPTGVGAMSGRITGVDTPPALPVTKRLPSESGLTVTNETDNTDLANEVTYILEHAHHQPELLNELKRLGLDNFVVSDKQIRPSSADDWTLTIEFSCAGYNPWNRHPLSISIPHAFFPGCCAYRIVHHIDSNMMAVPEGEGKTYRDVVTLQNRGIGTVLFKVFLQAMVKRECCTILVATTTDLQTVGIKLLERTGWKKVGDEFTNINTGHMIQQWEFKLKEYDKPHDRYTFSKISFSSPSKECVGS